MRKMTKKAVTIAAMSAMTAASASMAFAAEKQETNISSVAKEEEAVNSSAVGEWSGDDVKGWSFTKEGDVKLKDTWAQIDGVWYYFKGDKIVQNRFLTLDNKGYFFDESGRLATGWQKITSKMDAYSDIDIADELYDPTNNYYVQVDDNHEYDYHDYVWCYFDQSGVAKHNEWFQDSTGLWYYFDGDVMVKNVYNYRVNPDNYDAADSYKNKYYGFDENGAMLIGWNYKKVDKSWNDPTADEEGKIWYYYKSNGQMQSEGWAHIGDKWYLFANYDADRWSYTNGETDGVGDRDDAKWLKGGYPLIVNSYVASYNNKRGDSKYEYFYVNKKGEMVTGVQEVPKKAYKILFYTDTNYKAPNVAYEVVSTDKAVTVNFGSNGAATAGIKDNRYYVLEMKNTMKAKFGTNKSNEVWKVNNTLYNATYTFDSKTLQPTGTLWEFSILGNGEVNVDIPTPEVDPEDVRVYTPVYDSLKALAGDYLAGASASSNTFYILASNSTAVSLLEEAEKKATEINAGVTTTSVTGYLADAKAAKKVYDNILKETASGDVYAVKYPVAVSGYDPENTWWTLTNVDNKTAIQIDPNGDIISGRAADVYVNINTEIDKITKEIETAEKALSLWVGSKDQNYKDAEKAIETKKATLASLNKIKAYVEDCVEVYYEDDIKAASKNWKNAQAKLTDAMEELEVLERRLRDYAVYTKNGDDFVLIDREEVAEFTNDFTVVGEVVKNGFIAQNDYVYLADGNGDLLTNKAVLISSDANLSVKTTSNTPALYDNAYILFGSDGKGIYNYDGTRKSITIGGVTYWATDARVKIGSKAKDLTVFVSNKTVDGIR